MNKKAFTLAEILGVIVIVGLLSIIIVPNVINSIQSKKHSISDAQKEILFNAVELYMDSDKKTYTKNPGETYCISVEELQNKGYLSQQQFENITEPENGIKTINVNVDSDTGKVTMEVSSQSCS